MRHGNGHNTFAFAFVQRFLQRAVFLVVREGLDFEDELVVAHILQHMLHSFAVSGGEDEVNFRDFVLDCGGGGGAGRNAGMRQTAALHVETAGDDQLD